MTGIHTIPRSILRSITLGAILLISLLPLVPTGPPATAQGLSAVVVTRRFGAALRVYPSSDADVYVTASCGDTLSVVDSRAGWYQVYSRARYLWVGGARVADASSVSPSCAGARTFQIGDAAVTYVATGCLSLRYTPSRSAGYDSCVGNGHLYYVDNGPIEVNGEDWFQVWSANTGEGWSLAEFLYYP